MKNQRKAGARGVFLFLMNILLISGTVHSETVKVFEKPYIYTMRQRGSMRVFNREIEEGANNPNYLDDQLESFDEKAKGYFYTVYDKWFQYQSFRKEHAGSPEHRKYWPNHDVYKKFVLNNYLACKKKNVGFGTEAFRTMDLSVAYCKENPGKKGSYWIFGESKQKRNGRFSIILEDPGIIESNPGECRLDFDSIVGIFAFKEDRTETDDFYCWKITDVIEVTNDSDYEIIKKDGYYKIKGNWKSFKKGYRLYAIGRFLAEEFNYAVDDGLNWACDLVDEYTDMGVKMDTLYMDEPHIWWHWWSWNKYGDGLDIVNLIYMTDEFMEQFNKRYGADFKKYFPVIFPSPDRRGRYIKDTNDTLLFKARYYDMLQELFLEFNLKLKEHMEAKWGKVHFVGHDTWANTCGDIMATRELRVGAYDSWKFMKWWRDGGRSDYGESGHIEYDYYGFNLPVSYSKLGFPEWGYYGYWSVTEKNKRYQVRRIIHNIINIFGLKAFGTSSFFAPVYGFKTRRSRVLSIYPKYYAVYYPQHQWYTAFGYSDYMTDDVFKEGAKIVGKQILLNNNKYDALIVQWSPVIHKESIDRIKEFALAGGKVLIIGAPFYLDFEENPVKEEFENLIGADSLCNQLNEGKSIKSGKFVFCNSFEGIAGVREKEITRSHEYIDLPVFAKDVYDIGYRRIYYPVSARKDTEVVAKAKDSTVGVRKKYNNGEIIYLGFCPGRAALYEVLELIDAVDEPMRVSHNTDYIVKEFDNGAIAIAQHLKKPVNPRKNDLNVDVKIYGNDIKYNGYGSMAYRLDREGKLIAFAGIDTKGITINNNEYRFCEEEANVSFTPVSNGLYEKVYYLAFKGSGEYSLPIDTSKWKNPCIGLDRNNTGVAEIISRPNPSETQVIEITKDMKKMSIYLFDCE